MCPPLFSFLEPCDLTDFTIVVPCVTVGNVPQLTADLLICNRKLKKVATLWHIGLIAVAGADAYRNNRNELSAACELYVDTASKLGCLQMRSGLEFSLVTKFLEDFAKALHDCNVQRVIILSSGFDYALRTIGKDKFHYISNEDVDKFVHCNNVKLVEQDSNGEFYINGGNYTVSMYKALSDFIKTTVLAKYISEGDNIPDALETMEILYKLIGFDFNRKTTMYPPSWKTVFGGPPPNGIF